MSVSSTLRRQFVRFRDADTETRVLLIRHRYLPRLMSFSLYPLLLVLAVMLRIILIGLKPVVHIRFGRWPTESLGTFAPCTEIYLCEKDAGMYPKRALDIFFPYDSGGYMLEPASRKTALVCNQQLEVMFRRRIRVWGFAAKLDHLNRMLPGEGVFVALGAHIQPHDHQGLFQRFPKHLEFNRSEEERGFAEMREMGLDPEVPFVCFHSRDSGYADRDRPQMVSLFGPPGKSSMRNASIGNFLMAAQQLTEHGYGAIRMGKYVESPIDPPNSKVIDYAWNFHSDFMDVFLSARCSFFIGQDSGMTALPAIFRTPIAVTNVVPFSDLVYAGWPQSIFIPRPYYSAQEDRLLTFREILSDRRLSHYAEKFRERSRDYYNELGLEIRENSPEEIAELALEMEQRLRGTFEPSEEDEAMQRRFTGIISAFPEILSPFEDYQRIRIGTHFLRAHLELLD